MDATAALTIAYHIVIAPRHHRYVTKAVEAMLIIARRPYLSLAPLQVFITLTMPRGPSIPPYLTSGASSRAHHALLAQLSHADSPQEEDRIIAHHVHQAKAVLQSTDLNTVRFVTRCVQVWRADPCGQTRIAENLIVILHCSMLRHNVDDDLDFALIPALKLAESGKTIQERRIGRSVLWLVSNGQMAQCVCGRVFVLGRTSSSGSRAAAVADKHYP